MAKVLIIDDDPDVRKVMELLLKKHGFEVETASKEKDVFEKLELFQPAVILLDVLLSGADGRKICRQIKENAATQATPVIMISGHPGAAANYGIYGADDFIGKPVKGENLLRLIHKHLKQPNF